MKTAPDLKSDPLSLDSITLEVIRHGIVSITDQIDANIARGLQSLRLRIQGFCRRAGKRRRELIAQCTGGMPVFVADPVGMAVRDGLATYGAGRLHHGDVVICNHAACRASI